MTNDEKDPDEELVPADRAHELPEELRGEEVGALVERAQAGDGEALNELFTRYHGTLVDMARRRLGPKLRRKEDPDDLAQTTFREATRDFGRYEYRGEDSLLRWLMMILSNKIRDKAEYYSAGKRDMTRERSVEFARPDDEGDRMVYDPPSEDLSVTRQVQREEEFKILREALEDLSDDHRSAIALVFFRGLTLREAGKRLGGRSEDAVRMLLRRAEAKMRDLTRSRLAK
ncbi:MAG TPA: sigma-70 family RNA polymerase sigma factor [Planctomycetes bacterium]|nr:sigma-70 family RNA polymerase sigma factor [Planctomycetota bacterium]